MIVLIIGLIIGAVLAEVWSLRHGIDGITYRAKSDRRVVEPDEIFELHTIVENHKRFMAPYLKISENVPRELSQPESDEEKPIGTRGSYQITSECYLAGRQKVEFIRRVAIARRGWYGFFGASIFAGDFLGISGRRREYNRACEIVVKPKPAQTPGLEETLGGFLGEVSVRRFWMEDPMFLMGYRDYTGREPMKAISWTMTAKTGRMMVKDFDHTAEPTCTVVCDVGSASFRATGSEEQEECFSIARTVCEELEAKGFTYGFLSNAMIAGSGATMQEIFPGKGQAHLQGILEILGRATGYYDKRKDLPALLHRLLSVRTPGRACIIVSLDGGKGCRRLISHLEELTDCKTLVLQPGEKGGEGSDAVIETA